MGHSRHETRYFHLVWPRRSPALSSRAHTRNTSLHSYRLPAQPRWRFTSSHYPPSPPPSHPQPPAMKEEGCHPTSIISYVCDSMVTFTCPFPLSSHATPTPTLHPTSLQTSKQGCQSPGIVICLFTHSEALLFCFLTLLQLLSVISDHADPLHHPPSLHQLETKLPAIRFPSEVSRRTCSWFAQVCVSHQKCHDEHVPGLHRFVTHRETDGVNTVDLVLFCLLVYTLRPGTTKNGSERFVPEISGRPVTTRPITTVVGMSENWPADFPIANVTSMFPLPTSR